jgi:hypothetical protein
LFKDEPGGIPEYLVHKNSLYSVLDLKNGYLRYYENYHNRNELLGEAKIYEDKKLWDENALM